MEQQMSVENPTGGDTGASITDRLERFLSAEDAPEDQPQGNQQASQGSDAGAGDDDPEANADAPVDELTGDEQGDDDGPQLSTADLARVLGIDESTLDVDGDGNAVIKTKIDGKDGAAKLTDMLKSYQLQGHVDNQAREVAAQKQAIQQQLAHGDQAIRARLDQLDQTVNLASKELMREFDSVDWNYLRANDPGEYSAKLSDFQLRKGNIDAAAQHGATERQKLQAQQDEQTNAFLQQERERLPTLIPEWKDEAVANKERNDITAWALKNGFEQAELKGIVRSSAVVALRKAMLYDQLQGSKAAIENKVRTAPKLVKAGQAQQVSRVQNTVRTAKQNVRSSGGKTDAVAAFLLATGKA
jgi:hypothetical protein